MTTMIADSLPGTTRLGVGFDANRRGSANSEAWKRAIGTKPINARLELLPRGESRWDRIGISASIQILILLFLLAVPLLYPEKIKTVLNMQVVSLAAPVTEVPVAPPPMPKPKLPPPPKPEVIEPVNLSPKQPHIFLQPKALRPEIRKIEAKAPDMNPELQPAKIEANTKQPRRPRDEVKLENLSSGSAMPATVSLPVQKVQTGGFGEANGLPGKGDANKAANINRQGLPALPGGPGYGNGTGGNKGVRGTVASTGFGNGTALATAAAKRGTVQSSGFTEASTASETPRKKTAAAGNPTSPVDILDKPHPEYTAEGRNLKIEGDVVLDVVFLASGSVQVNSVISGLGHGLDDAATRAAQRIKFNPAKRDGQAIDFPARVRIEFRLAY